MDIGVVVELSRIECAFLCAVAQHDDAREEIADRLEQLLDELKRQEEPECVCEMVRKMAREIDNFYVSPDAHFSAPAEVAHIVFDACGYWRRSMEHLHDRNNKIFAQEDSPIRDENEYCIRFKDYDPGDAEYAILKCPGGESIRIEIIR